MLYKLGLETRTEQEDVGHEQDDVSQDNLNSVLDPDTPDDRFFRDPAGYSGSHEERVLKLIGAEKLEHLALTREQVDTIKLDLLAMPEHNDILCKFLLYTFNVWPLFSNGT